MLLCSCEHSLRHSCFWEHNLWYCDALVFTLVVADVMHAYYWLWFQNQRSISFHSCFFLCTKHETFFFLMLQSSHIWKQPTAQQEPVLLAVMHYPPHRRAAHQVMMEWISRTELFARSKQMSLEAQYLLWRIYQFFINDLERESLCALQYYVN